MTSESNKEKLAGRIAGAILSTQERLSNRMNRFKGLKTLLIVFCIVSAGLSTYFLVDAITRKPKAKIKVDRIRTPRPAYETPEEMYDEKIPEAIYYNIQNYRRYMDSIGEPIRPGLADSMRMLEEMYLQQQK
jgi:hypothetical protein